MIRPKNQPLMARPHNCHISLLLYQHFAEKIIYVVFAKVLIVHHKSWVWKGKCMSNGFNALYP